MKNPESSSPDIQAKLGRNRLVETNSPYLLQHADNPVDWFPWGPAAIEKARVEDKPIFLSIGYSSCHWCHVMAHESFEDLETARVMNAHFVCVKVDREERPDIDELYMSAVVALTGSGGWPLSVFLAPDLRPFYGGTYFPPRSAHGLPSFRDLLTQIAVLWEGNRADLLENASKLTETLRVNATLRGPGELEPGVVSNLARSMRDGFDPVWGGFGGAPKFPAPAAIRLLLRHHRENGEPEALEMTERTLTRMARGGVYDQLGGGFHRYSVDERWLVPHFEKMLYDNAQLAAAYVEAWLVARKPLYRRIATETLDYIARGLRDPAGGFHSAEDADSPEGEGAYYVWTRAEIEALLGPAEAEEFCRVFGVDRRGNFEGRSILNVPLEIEEAEPDLEERVAAVLGRNRLKLLEARSRRATPSRDDKVLTAWNGMAISSLCLGWRVFEEDRWLEAAREAARSILEKSRSADGGLRRCRRGGRAEGPAFVDDYAEFINALVDLYESDFDPEWLKTAGALADRMISDFHDTESGAFFHAPVDGSEERVARSLPFQDGVTPSGNSAAALALWRLGRLLDREDLALLARGVLAANGAHLSAYPRAFMDMLLAAGDHSSDQSMELVFVGDTAAPEMRDLLRTARSRFTPTAVSAAFDPARHSNSNIEETIPLLKDRTEPGGGPRVYVCRNRSCRKPVGNAEELAKILD